MNKGLQLFIKNVFDRIVALLVLVLLSPLLIIIVVIIKITSKGPVIFKQKRVGKNLIEFNVYKFRSMIVNAENIGAGLYFDGENDPRITKIGKFIRKTSIDELPQFLNILRGDMSLIGPRPLLPITYQQMTSTQKSRSLIKPGITGLAQVNGRNNLSMRERIDKDLYYINHFSLLLDIKIIFMTIKILFTKDGINLNQKPQDVENF